MVNILYQDAFESMRIDPKNLMNATFLLHRFTSESIYSEGRINLIVTLGEAPEQATAIVEFMVVKGKSAYNAIIQRPILSKTKAVTFIYIYTKFARREAAYQRSRELPRQAPIGPLLATNLGHNW